MGKSILGILAGLWALVMLAAMGIFLFAFIMDTCGLELGITLWGMEL